MQHLEDFRRLYFHMCDYIGMNSGFSGGVYQDIQTHGVCRNIHARGVANY